MRIGPTDQLIYSTCLDAYHAPANPPGENIIGLTIAVEGAGNAYIAGTNTDPGFPIKPGAFQTPCCPPDSETAFLVKLNPPGTASVCATFLPRQSPTSVAVDANGNATLTIDAATVSNNQVTSITITTAQLNTEGSQLLQVVNTPLPPRSNFWASPDGQGNLLIARQPPPDSFAVSEGAFANGASYLEIIRADGDILYINRLPPGAGGSGVGPEGAEGLIVLGPNSFPVASVPSGRSMVMLTRFEPATTLQPTILGIANAFGSVSKGLAPGEIVGLYGTNLGPAEGVWAAFEGGTLPASLGGTQVRFNCIAVPILPVHAGQVNAVLPFEVAGAQAVSVALRANSASSNTVQLAQLPSEPWAIGKMGSAEALNQSINRETVVYLRTTTDRTGWVQALTDATVKI
jgi:hypothetical protein